MQFPVTITNIHGEKLTFLRITKTGGGEIIEVENEVQPKAGPPMHIHWRQDECLTVVEGKIGYLVQGGTEQFAGPGETVIFKAGVAHKFWNAGTDVLKCKGWISPPDNIIYFLSEIYKSTNENGGRPGTFDAAYLLDRYKTEFKMTEIPGFVQNAIFPVVLFFGKLAGKHRKFKDAPLPVG
ncbi:MAG: cupin protein [Flavipsychrobacter sp.]|jgi:quercetin dioxygenase-like cupin family protein|nr:cupin protein [Flavipsychrobacter sp.]